MESSKKIESLSTIQVLITIWHSLKKRRKYQFFVLVFIMLLSGISEIISIGIIVPFLGILTNPVDFIDQPIIIKISEIFNIESTRSMVILITIIFCFLTLIASLVRLLNLWLNLRFAASIGSDISIKSYYNILYQNYDYHCDNNSSSIISTITTQTNSTVNAISQILRLITSTVVLFSVCLSLVVLSWQISILSLILLIGPYFILSRITKKKIISNGKIVANSIQIQLKVVQEGLGAIRDVIIENSQKTYIEKYKKNDISMRIKQSENQFLANFPRFAMEGLGLSTLGGVSAFYIISNQNTTNFVPIIGALALGLQRIMPIMQQLYSGLANIRSYSAAVYKVINILGMKVEYSKEDENVKPLPFYEKIEFKDVKFSYAQDSKLVLNQINLIIEKGETVGIIGTTGSGKSTLIDILLGLLKPVSGKLLIDGEDIYSFNSRNKIKSWHKNLSHVPQNIYLSDGTISENIAFGKSKDKIDIKQLRKVAQQAQAEEFILSKPFGYNLEVGERGVRLSGGQCQRIGFARALYKDSSVLILDEATSALDTKTEQKIMDSFKSLNKDVTIVIVAHRLSTLVNCDKIIELREGEIYQFHTPISLGLKEN